MEYESISIPEDFTGQVPLFPLPNLVCFPSNVVPLHIFESRYRDMMADTLAGDQIMAMATLEEGYQPDYHGRPAIAPVVCVGKIATHRHNADGTYDMAFVGLRRATMDHEIEPVLSYRRGQVDLMLERSDQNGTPAFQSMAVRLIDAIRPSLPAIDSVSKQFPPGALPLDTLTDIVAFHHDFDLATKLWLLGENDPMRRATRIISELGQESPASGYPPQFSDN